MPSAHSITSPWPGCRMEVWSPSISVLTPVGAVDPATRILTARTSSALTAQPTRSSSSWRWVSSSWDTYNPQPAIPTGHHGDGGQGGIHIHGEAFVASIAPRVGTGHGYVHPLSDWAALTQRLRECAHISDPGSVLLPMVSGSLEPGRHQS